MTSVERISKSCVEVDRLACDRRGITSQRFDIHIPGLNGTMELKGVNGKAVATVGVFTQSCPSEPWSSEA